MLVCHPRHSSPLKVLRFAHGQIDCESERPAPQVPVPRVDADAVVRALERLVLQPGGVQTQPPPGRHQQDSIRRNQVGHRFTAEDMTVKPESPRQRVPHPVAPTDKEAPHSLSDSAPTRPSEPSWELSLLARTGNIARESRDATRRRTIRRASPL